MTPDNNFSSYKQTSEIAGETLEVQIGKFAPQAGGSVLLKYGETVVLATVVMTKRPREAGSFLPLVVDYEERLYAAGKISTSRFIKREGRPSEEAILTARLVDRAIRPLFPSGFYNEVQIILTVLSIDAKNDPDIVSLLATSLALSVSEVPFEGPLGALRIGRIDGEFIINPKYTSREKSDLDLVVAGAGEKITMLDLRGKEIKEEDLLKALEFAQKHIKKLITLQEKIISKAGKEKYKIPEKEKIPRLEEEIKKIIKPHLEAILSKEKLSRDDELKNLKENLYQYLEEKFSQEDQEKISKEADLIFSEEIKKIIRKNILEEGKRMDRRALDELREISLKVGILPRTHGSGMISRGYTQVLSIITLGGTSAVQVLQGLEPETTKRFMHHYNFPPFSVGEVAHLRAPSRREIGHGSLAERALLPLIPSKEDFPYTIRVVSEILSSDGSTSMASVASSSLALMDAGVPIKKPVAGISIGLVSEDKKYKLLTDITGLEDFCGDMDFKIAGTEDGITSSQLDTKLKGVPIGIIAEALKMAQRAYLLILEKMKKTIPTPRSELSPYAPRIITLKVNPEKIRDIIGPGGKTINKIIAETGVEIDIEPEGIVQICSTNAGGSKRAKEWIESLTHEFRLGEIYQGKVTRVEPYGAFVEIFPGQEGLVHISQLAPFRVKKVEDIVKVGQTIPVMVIDIDELGRVSLSYKAASRKSP